MEYVATLKIKILENYASFSDFEYEIEQFNQANKDVIEVQVLNYEVIK